MLRSIQVIQNEKTQIQTKLSTPTHSFMQSSIHCFIYSTLAHLCAVYHKDK